MVLETVIYMQSPGTKVNGTGRNESSHDKNDKMTVRPVKTQISLGIPQSDCSLRCPREESLGP